MQVTKNGDVIQMQLQNEHSFHAWERRVRQTIREPSAKALLSLGAAFLCGFCLSAARLGGTALPLCMAVLCVGLPGWCGMSFALGGSLGYWVFWSYSGMEGLVWIAGGLAVGELLDARKKQLPLLLPGLGTLIVAVSGLIFQIALRTEQTAVPLYLLRLGVAFGGVCLAQAGTRRNTLTDAALMAVGVLALAQIAPTAFLNFGIFAATVISLEASFPAAVLAGLALDLSAVAAVPMTAVMCLIRLTARLSVLPKKSRVVCPALLYLLVMALCGKTDFAPVSVLVLGGAASLLVPQRQAVQASPKQADPSDRAQALASVFSQARQYLRDTPACPIDEGALIARAAERACGECERRRDCAAAERIHLLPQTMLYQNAVTTADVPAACRKKERLLAQLQQSRDHHRLLQADRRRQRDYRAALMQQYAFLSEQLLTLTDTPVCAQAHFRAQVAVCSRGKEAANGDRCVHFATPDGRYCVLLCDGMGTGDAAAYEARTAAAILRRMLCAGYSAEAAMQSINSLCVLRGSAGAVTVDLAQAELATARAEVYKWGAAPSWLLAAGKCEKLGHECPPPGVSIEDACESVEHFSLKDGAYLLMFSDGVDGEKAVRAITDEADQPVGFLAALCLESGAADPTDPSGTPDDATAAVLRLTLLEP